MDVSSRDELGRLGLTLVDVVRERTGVNLSSCFQCQKCSSGCTVAAATDLLPHVLVRKLQLGEGLDVLRSRAIWLCVGCQTCTTRCPNEIDLAAVMDALRETALEAGVEPAEGDVAAFHRVVLETIRHHGRLFELGMIFRLKTETGHYVKDLRMGLDLMRRGKIRLVASRIRDPREVAALFEPEPDEG